VKKNAEIISKSFHNNFVSHVTTALQRFVWLIGHWIHSAAKDRDDCKQRTALYLIIQLINTVLHVVCWLPCAGFSCSPGSCSWNFVRTPSSSPTNEFVVCPSSFSVGYNYVASSVTVCGPSPLLDNIWAIIVVWRIIGKIIRALLCWIMRHIVHSHMHTDMSSSYRWTCFRIRLNRFSAFLCFAKCKRFGSWDIK